MSDSLYLGYRLLACDGSDVNITRDPVPAILMADHGYESFNTFAHLIREKMKFVIRRKDINSNGILSS
ncbi:hypothetical protein [Acetivibrio ethanolgignens]|uniref:Transposase IS4-like domain-containing protein n=1 Tax=Acetivibrio ethanolgignens TaxID=290052 RepID=A0A0V8QHE0_9FIRM|nr:hypothetical protein [Acetivibrio ethanolgignens]KSV59975.1 hypothetical protein ASU35_17715 [Acetivibrio ethanolgignens]